MRASYLLVKDIHVAADIVIVGAFSKKEITQSVLVKNDIPKEWLATLNTTSLGKQFTGDKGQHLYLPNDNKHIYFNGLGKKESFQDEDLRRFVANALHQAKSHRSARRIGFWVDSFLPGKKCEESLFTAVETALLTDYSFHKYKSKHEEDKLEIIFFINKPASFKTKADKILELAKFSASSINFCRDVVNEPPNHIWSETYAKEIEKDVKAHLKNKGVKIEILGKKELQKERMNLFLSVNAASAHEPKLIHLTYTPKKTTTKTKHIALVGKGITFDTGGLCIKPSGSMANMKFDMAGSATVYAAFRVAVLAGAPYKISCFMGITDNAISNNATMPDSIFTSRGGKTVEVLNTDAEGRLVLADVIDYACDFNPDEIIDVATLTGAVVQALSEKACGLMGNNDALVNRLLKSSREKSEPTVHLPLFDFYLEDMRCPIADLQNIGSRPTGGAQKAGAFLKEFVRNDIPWAHLDIAGIGDTQGHLPYCPKKGGSGMMVRTLVHYLTNGEI